MKLPFTLDQFLEIFRQYNVAIWPAQGFFILIALVALYFSISRRSYSNKVIVVLLSFFWLWMGIVYHLEYFSSINKAAIGFGIIFVLQALLFLYFGIVRKKLNFHFLPNKYGITGLGLIVFALLIYPLLGYLLGHRYPFSPTFGLPCPTTIFTFGMVLLSVSGVPFWVIIIPFIWSIIGFSAAFSLGIKEDTSLLIAGVLSIVLILHRNKSLRTSK